MNTEPNGATEPSSARSSAATWMRARVTVTTERWVLVAIGVAALALLLLALD